MNRLEGCSAATYMLVCDCGGDASFWAACSGQRFGGDAGDGGGGDWESVSAACPPGSRSFSRCGLEGVFGREVLASLL